MSLILRLTPLTGKVGDGQLLVEENHSLAESEVDVLYCLLADIW
jgi:hypothetical protein